jgi:hypothetical protein
MVQGLADGLSAAGKSLSTGGKEGGAEEVQQLQAQRQQMKQSAVASAQAQTDAELRNKLTTAQTNQANINNHILTATMPDEISLSHMKVPEAQTKLAGEQQGQAIAGADFQAQHGGMKPTQFNSALAGTTPAAGATGASAFFTTNAQQQLGAAQKILGAQDPYVQKLQSALADPKATPKDLWTATSQIQNQVALQEKATTAQTQKNAADPLYKLETDPSEMTGDKAPAAVALLSSKLTDPNLSADQKPRVQRLFGMAQKAQANALTFDKAKETAKQTITDGDPKAAGSLLQSGLVSPQELISSRKPAFAQQAFDEAIRLGGGTKGADGKWTGGTWSATKAESQYDYAKNPKTQNTLNLLTTMQNPGGSIDIAQNMFKQIPGKIDEGTFNKLVTGAQTEFGGVSTVDFKAAMTSLADEYAQVLQGGAATETTLSQAKDLIKQAYTASQGSGAFDTIRLDMAARQKGMVRDNPALMSMYPSPAAAPAGASNEVWVGGKLTGHVVGNKYVALGQ